MIKKELKEGGSRYYSQHGEDRRLEVIFPGAEGICVEVGALDGVVHSNTLHFESKGWKTILVEPNPVLCDAIRKSRTGVLFGCAASDGEGVAALDVCDSLPALSTMRGEDRLSVIPDGAGEIRRVPVPTRTMDAMLAECGIGKIDFISIDVEGHELSVLRGLSLSRWNPRVVIIEDLTELTGTTVSDHMAREGYARFLRTACNDWYARTTDRELFTWRAAANRLYWKCRISTRRNLPGAILPVARGVFRALTGKV